MSAEHVTEAAPPAGHALLEQLRAAGDALGRALSWLEAVRPRNVLAVFVIVEWLTILGVALVVRHNGWIYYQGGDQLWNYVTAWLWGHGRLAHTSIGYGWSIVLFPFALLGGPNLVSPLPFILLFNVLVLMPVAILSAYGIGQRLGGRLFGYWTALLWVVVPLIGIEYTNAGYHQRYTELLLPQTLGLAVMSDFPSMAVSAAAAYFVLRAAQDDDRSDALLAGVLVGIAIGIKPSNAPVLVGGALALLVARRWRSMVWGTVGLAPSILALTVWKAQGEGTIPLFHRATATGEVLVASAAPVLALGLHIHTYFHPSWQRFAQELDSMREHFWSVRVLEGLFVAGVIGLLRKSRPAGVFFGGWFATVLLVKWANQGSGTVDNADLLRQTISAVPAALVILAGVLLLFPGVPQKLPRPKPRPWTSRRFRAGLVAALLTLFAAVPIALAAALPVLENSDTISYYTQTGSSLSAPFAVDSGWRPAATVGRGGVSLTWSRLDPLGGTMDYVVLRAPASRAIVCDQTAGGAQCRLNATPVDATHGTRFVDHIGAGRWTYRIGAAASWINDPTAGDIYVVGRAVTVTAR
ncbi:MAG: glycosyltransferase family 39 protein [Acidobacteriota bacterium]|nr:glycosyltransferase family 39 protein [Acidobacteriota bacterium]